MSIKIIRKTVPLVITFLVGLLMIGQWFLNVPSLDELATFLQQWGILIAAFAMGLGSVNIIIRSVHRIQKREGTDWLYAIWLLIVFFLFAITGIGFGPASSQYKYIFNTILQPLSVTMYPATLFFLVSAIYRTFKIRTVEGGLFVIVSAIILLANAPIMSASLPFLVTLKSWIMDVELTAAYRAILLGIGLGAIMLGFRIIFGLETTHLGREEGT